MKEDFELGMLDSFVKTALRNMAEKGARNMSDEELEHAIDVCNEHGSNYDDAGRKYEQERRRRERERSRNW